MIYLLCTPFLFIKCLLAFKTCLALNASCPNVCMHVHIVYNCMCMLVCVPVFSICAWLRVYASVCMYIIVVYVALCVCA